MPTPEEYQKRLERLVKLGSRLRVCTKDYLKYKGPHTYESMVNAQREFDKVIREENAIIQSKQPDLPF